MGDFDRRQLEQLSAIGEYLQHIRQDQGRSLDDISAKTYIPLRILRALEAAQGNILPEAVFVQGFIRRYGDALGLDGITLSKSFPVERESASYEPPERERRESTPALTETRIPDVSRSDYGRSNYSKPDPPSETRTEEKTSSRRPSVSLPAVIAGVVVLGGLVYGLSRLLFSPQRPAATVNSATAPAASPSPVPAASAPTASAPAVSPTPASASPTPAARTANPPATSAPVNVAMNVTDRAWVQVIADGRIVYEGTLTKGTQRNWSAQQEITVVSGNAGGVSLSHNQEAAKPMGASGTVEEVTFTANSDNSSASGAASN